MSKAHLAAGLVITGQFVAIDHLVLAHHLEQLDTVLPGAKERKEICRLRFLRRIEAKNANDGGIAADNLAISPHHEDPGKILRYQTAVPFGVGLVRRAYSIFLHGAGAVGVTLGCAGARDRRSSSPPETKT